MYQWVVFLHVLGAFGFLMAHAVSTAVVLRLRREREMERIKALLELSQLSLIGMYIFVMVLLGSGILAGFMGNWWGQWWIWVAIGIPIALSAVMYPLGTQGLGRVQKVVGLPYAEGRNRTQRVEAAFRAVPRHLFLPGHPLEKVYSDEAIVTKHLAGQAPAEELRD